MEPTRHPPSVPAFCAPRVRGIVGCTRAKDPATIDAVTPPPSARILVVDDEPAMCLSVARALRSRAGTIETTTDADDGLEKALSGDFDVLFVDVRMPGRSGIDILRQVLARGLPTQVVVITGNATVESAVEAMHIGAADYLAKPFTPERLRLVADRVLERSRLLRENAELRRHLGRTGGFEGVLGASPAMERLFSLLRRVGPSEGTVLLTGESGTGKELVAEALHRLSPRRGRPFVACDCSALSAGLLESELFGHVKGAFTGAVASRAGLLEAADRGTLFLDEVSNIGLETQGKLLRVLESRRVRRVGETNDRSIDIRLVGATNRDLHEKVREGSFREDLLYRLEVVPVRLPPLRERHGDVARLAAAFLERYRSEHPGTAAERLSPEVLQRMEAWSWPGNVRELKNVIERMAILSRNDVLGLDDLPQALRNVGEPESEPAEAPGGIPESWTAFQERRDRAQKQTARTLEQRYFEQLLAHTEGNVAAAARHAGMQRTHLHALLRKHGLRGGTAGAH